MFELELEKAVLEVKNRNAKRVVIQLPDGLKAKSNLVADTIEKETGAEVLIWLNSCYGACDLPLGLEVLNIDLMIQWGHNRYHKVQEMW